VAVLIWQEHLRDQPKLDEYRSVIWSLSITLVSPNKIISGPPSGPGKGSINYTHCGECRSDLLFVPDVYGGSTRIKRGGRAK